jgi:hypothetical protein
MTDTAFQLVTAVIIVAVVFLLVRPGSPAGTAIKDVSTALAGLVGTATGYTFQSGSSTS